MQEEAEENDLHLAYVSIPLSPRKTPPLMALTRSGLMKLLDVCYKSSNPHRTLEIFTASYQIPLDLLLILVSDVEWNRIPVEQRKSHPMGVIQQDVELIKSHGHGMLDENIKIRFLFYANSLCHLWAERRDKDGKIYLAKLGVPVFFKAPNIRAPFVRLCPNEFGLPEVVQSYMAPHFTATLTRREKRGNLMTLELDFLKPAKENNNPCPHLCLDVVMDDLRGFCLTAVTKVHRAPSFMLLLTTQDGLYCDTIFIQPSTGQNMPYPVAVHLLQEEEED